MVNESRSNKSSNNDLEPGQRERMERVFRPVGIPVFGDTHGDLEGMFREVQRLQMDTGKTFQYVFQVGDFGFFPTVPTTPDNTWRSPEEGGVYHFLKSREMYAKYFEKATGLKQLECKVIFVRGNREDQDTLKELENRHPEGAIPVDDHQTLYYLADGRGISIQTGPESDVVIAGYGGISPESRPKAFKRNRLVGYNSETAVDRLLNLKPDVLITHQGTSKANKGDKTITALCELIKPEVHIHGHSHNIEGPYDLGNTKSYGLARLPKNPTDSRKGFYGIIECGKNVNFTLSNQSHSVHQAN